MDMIYTVIKWVRLFSVTIGFILATLAFGFPFSSSCKWNEHEDGTVEVLHYSYDRAVDFIPYLLVVSVFLSGYFRQDLLNKALLYTFSSMLILFIVAPWLVPTWGLTPCSIQIEIGGVFFVIGSLLVILGTFLSIYRQVE